MEPEAISRTARRPAPPLPTGELSLDPPPAIPAAAGNRWRQALTVMPMLAGTVATAMMFGGREGSGAYTYVVGGIFGLSTLGMLATTWSSGGGPGKNELIAARGDYLRYLGGMRHRVRSVIADQRAALAYRHPAPESLWGEILGPRVWERRSGDTDFAVVRVGAGPQSLATPLVAPTIDPTVDLEPVTAGALRRFLDTYSIVSDLPVCIALSAFHHVVLADRDGLGARGLARAMLCQLATFHPPRDLVIIAWVAPARRRDWDWLKWLPHVLHPRDSDALGPRRLVADSAADLDQLLRDIVDSRPIPAPTQTPRFGEPLAGGRRSAAGTGLHVVVVVDTDAETDNGTPAASGALTVLRVHTAPAAPQTPTDRDTLVLSRGPTGDLTSSTAEEQVRVGRSDSLTIVEAEALARRLAHRQTHDDAEPAQPVINSRDLTTVLRAALAGPVGCEPGAARRVPNDLLRTPIGRDPQGAVVELDIKEAAQSGMGPHGLIVGATGSGKSELLRTLVLGLAATHSSEALNCVLIDFKGGATFASLDRLPHTSAVITNLADELPLVDRMSEALTGELTRRQELLRRAGNVASVRDYDKARAAGANLPPIPALLVVCDEFTELLTAKPEFIDLFLQMGRLGRSLAIHLLLATQRLEEGRLRGLESHLSYRIALRTFTSTESRIVLGVADAAELPREPGHGFLRIGTGGLQRFTTTYVSGPAEATADVSPDSAALGVRQYTTHHVPVARRVESSASRPDSAGGGRTLFDTVIDRLADSGPAAHQVWLPPLTDSPDLADLIGPLTHDPAAGLTTADVARRGRLRVPIATVDKPAEQRRDVAWLDLSGAAGHVAIVGNPQSGKSTAVRSLLTSLAVTHTPAAARFYCLDFGGGSLSALRDFPHVGSVAGRADPALVRRTVGEIATLLADREHEFAARGIASADALRGPDASADPTLRGDVFLVIDGWSTVRAEFDDLEAVVLDIANRGLSYGIHLIVTSTRWSDLRSARDLFGSHVELRLGDPADSAIDRRRAANVPRDAPGRGLDQRGLHLLVALPQHDGRQSADLGRALAAAWLSDPVPPVRMLPALLPYQSILDSSSMPIGSGSALPIGIAEADLRPVLLDLGSDPHLIAFGDSECGKSSLLRGIAESIMRRFTPDQARIVLVDYRRSLLGVVATDHLIGYGTTAETTAPLISAVGSHMDRRLPGPEVTPEQLRTRSWWNGPELFVLVDDYDLVASGSTNPLLPLRDHLAQARDVGLHLIVTRRAGGASRALYEPLLQRMRELGAPVLVMSGDRDEGPLVGNLRPGPQPPGRGWLANRKDGVRLIQLAYCEPVT